MTRKHALAASLNGTAIRIDGSARSVSHSMFITISTPAMFESIPARIYDAQNPNADWRPEIARGANVRIEVQ